MPALAGLNRLRRPALAAACVGLLITLIGAWLDLDQFFRAYLFGWLFWAGVALGCLAIVMIQHVTGGAWGLVIRRILEAATRTLPWMALLFVPLLFGLPRLYAWARPGEVAADPLLQHKQPYLNVSFFTVRAAIYFASWIGLVWLLNRMSRAQDKTGDEKLVRRFQLVSAPGLLLFVLTMTFASVDWVMSLEPHWFSTIYGVLLMSGMAVSAFSFAIAMLVLLAREEPLSGVITANHMHDLGKLLFAFVMVWAYFALSQFLIAYGGNLPEEIPWYLRRLQGGWEWVGLAVILLHFALPFLLLLMRRVKRDAGRLVKVALLVFGIRIVDLYWMMAPAWGEPGRFQVHWLDIGAPVALGGFWLWLFARELGRMPLLPMRDPYLQEALSDGHES